MASSKFLFYIAKVYSINIIEPIRQYLDQTSHDYRFYISEKVEKKFPKEWDRMLICHDLNEAKEFNPDFVLSPGNFVDHRIPGVKVQLFHGLGVEKEAHYTIRGFFDIYMTSGPYVTERFKALADGLGNYFDVIETGWPKIDYILNYDLSNFKSNQIIQSGKKIILYAPTFSSSMQSATDLLPVIPTMIKQDELWIMKFHELMPLQNYEDTLSQLPENIFILDKKDEITPYLHLADVMISDTSSVIYEFMILKKPVITYKTIARTDKGINITQSHELRAALDKIFINPKFLQECINRQIAEINPYIDGKISQRVINSLEKINPNVYPKPNKPKNLFRKFKLIYHSIFKKGYLK